MYYPLGGGIADVLTKFVPGMKATAGITDGSVDNLLLIGAASPTSDSRWRTPAGTPIKGEDKFEGKRQCARADGAVSEPHARGDRRRHRHQQDGRPEGQARVDRRAHSATEVMAFRVIEAYGIDRRKI